LEVLDAAGIVEEESRINRRSLSPKAAFRSPAPSSLSR